MDGYYLPYHIDVWIQMYRIRFVDLAHRAGHVWLHRLDCTNRGSADVLGTTCTSVWIGSSYGIELVAQECRGSFIAALSGFPS